MSIYYNTQHPPHSGWLVKENLSKETQGRQKYILVECGKTLELDNAFYCSPVPTYPGDNATSISHTGVTGIGSLGRSHQ